MIDRNPLRFFPKLDAVRPWAALVLGLVCLLGVSCAKEKIGFQWEAQDSQTTYNLTSVHFVNALQGQAVGGDSWYYGVDLRTDDGGQTWQADSLTDKLLYQVFFDEQQRGYLSGINGYFFSKETPEADWHFTRLNQWGQMKAIAVNPDGQVLLGGGSAYKAGFLIRLDEDFEVDTVFTLDHEISSISFATDQMAIAVGYGILLRTEDAGQSWATLPVTGDFYRSVHFPTPEIGYVVGFAGSILKSTDAGRTWSVLRNGGSPLVGDKPFRSVFFVDERKGYLVGENGTFWRTLNGGDSWQVIHNFPKEDFFDIHVVENEGWLVGRNGRIIHFQE